MSARVHLHLHVSDLAKSREFYEKFLGAGPVKVKPGYVKFLPEWAPVNLALSGGGAAGAGGTAAAGAGLLGVAALTAVWQGAESWAMCCFRQASASAPPRGTPEQFAMKSDRHDARIALI